MRPVLLFDVMDTLVYNPFNQEIPAFFAMSRQELLAEKNPDAWIQFELGQIDEAEYFRNCFADGRIFDHKAFLSVVRQAYRWVDGAKPLLSELCQQGFEIHALSNYPIWYRTIEAQLKLSQFLNWTFVSCLTGVRKPDCLAFQRAAQGVNRAVEDCLFVDDSLANCQAAESVGIPAIAFSDIASLWNEMRHRRLVN